MQSLAVEYERRREQLDLEAASIQQRAQQCEQQEENLQTYKQEFYQEKAVFLKSRADYDVTKQEETTKQKVLKLKILELEKDNQALKEKHKSCRQKLRSVHTEVMCESQRLFIRTISFLFYYFFLISLSLSLSLSWPCGRSNTL